jgi:beta-lactamase superfamily II metal-dependent hydrolase
MRCIEEVAMRRPLWCVLVIAFVVGVASTAGEVKRERSIYTRGSPPIGEPGTLLMVHIIDVGDGDAILIDTPADKKILIDGGWTWGEDEVAEPEYRAYLAEFLGAGDIDLVVISHPDYDHFVGLADIVRTHKVGQVWYTGYDSPKLSPKYWRPLLKTLRELEPRFLAPVTDSIEVGSPVVFDDGGTSGSADDVVLTIINAPSEISETAYGSNRHLGENQRRNSSSLVVRLDYGKTSSLFTGDTNGRRKLSSDAEECDDQELLMSRRRRRAGDPLKGKLRCTVLKVAHHGSDGSSSLPFLRAAHPA